jgi:hypothetical protein
MAETRPDKPRDYFLQAARRAGWGDRLFRNSGNDRRRLAGCRGAPAGNARGVPRDQGISTGAAPARRRRNTSRILHPAITAIDLLYDDGARGKQIIGDFKPTMTKAEYLALRAGAVQEKNPPKGAGSIAGGKLLTCAFFICGAVGANARTPASGHRTGERRCRRIPERRIVRSATTPASGVQARIPPLRH